MSQESITNNTHEISKDDRERVRGVLQQYRENIAYHYQKWGDKNEPNYNGEFIDQIEKGLENNVSYEVDLGGLPAGGHFMLFYSLADAAGLELGGTPKRPILRIRSSSEIDEKKFVDRERLYQMSDSDLAEAVKKLTKHGELNMKLVELIVDHRGDNFDRIQTKARGISNDVSSDVKKTLYTVDKENDSN